MREIVLDASGWRCRDDFFDAFFAAVGAPVWHGRNFNALWDSLVSGEINQIEVPDRIVVRGLNRAAKDASEAGWDFVDLVERMGDEGCPVEIVVENRAGGLGRGNLSHRLWL